MVSALVTVCEPRLPRILLYYEVTNIRRRAVCSQFANMASETGPKKKRPRHDWTIADKIWLLDFRAKSPKTNAVDLGVELAKHVNASRTRDQVQIAPPGKSTVNDWIRAEKQLRELFSSHSQDIQRARGPSHPDLEDALELWFRQQESRQLTLTNEMVRAQARRFAPQLNVPDTFSFSDGWLQRFKNRHGIRRITLHGEADSADQQHVQLARDNMKYIVEGYSLDDIYNQDETGVFWRQLPTRSLATGKRAGRKKDKQRVTASITCNATGTDKRELFIIGKANRPRCFPKGFRPERDWGVRYRNNSKAWMLSAEFSEWVHEWNAKLRQCVPNNQLRTF